MAGSEVEEKKSSIEMTSVADTGPSAAGAATAAAAASDVAEFDDSGGLFGGSPDEAPGVDPPSRWGPLQWMYFQWVAPLVSKGSKEPLQMHHLWRLHPRNTARSLQSTYNVRA